MQDKHYNYATTIYPESAIENFKDAIANWHVQAFLSPLHDKDVNDDGSRKKAHWHLEVMFRNGRSESAVRELFVSIGGVGCEILKDKVAYARYLCHLDEKGKKVLYNLEDVVEFGGADYKKVIENCGRSKFEVYGEIMDYIDTVHCKSYAQLLRYARKFEPDWFSTLCKNGMVVKDYMRSNNFDEEMRDDAKPDITAWKCRDKGV